jgi:uncharacterized Zn finger protein
MSYRWGGWAPYVSVAERRKTAEKLIKKQAKQGSKLNPVAISGKKIAKTFWGKAWCDNLESYRDFEHRLERGRSYVRNGLVIDLQIAPKEIKAQVSGSDLYKVSITITAAAAKHWADLRRDCAGSIASLVELLQGRFPAAVMQRICRQGTGLFPAPSEIRFKCSCPDHAAMCKHVAATLYGVGARLDEDPALLFHLRALDATELLPDIGSAAAHAVPRQDSANTLVADDLAALFGLDMAPDEAPAAPTSSPPPGKPKKSEAAVPPRRVTPPKPAKPAAKTSGVAAAKPRAKPGLAVKPGKVTIVAKAAAAPKPAAAALPVLQPAESRSKATKAVAKPTASAANKTPAKRPAPGTSVRTGKIAVRSAPAYGGKKIKAPSTAQPVLGAAAKRRPRAQA